MIYSNLRTNRANSRMEQQEPVKKDYDHNIVLMRKQLEAERAAREQAEEKAALLEAERQALLEGNGEQEFIDNLKLAKTLNQFDTKIEKKTQTNIQRAVQEAIAQERQQQWLKQNPDFESVLKHADKIAEKDPELAETILQMPEGFDRFKLAYRTIKSMGLDKPEQKEPSIQDKINANRKSPYYQPSGMSAAPYAGQGDFSPVGQKNAYDKLQELKRNLRL